MKFYHGSKSGIVGAISPSSRKHCDFGKGFYMGTSETQPLTLICNYPEAKLYTLEADISELKILELGADINWALFVAFNRNKMEDAANTDLYKKISHMADGFDMISGCIADDRMFIVLDRFFSGEITDTALINCLSALDLGMQYAAVTEKACQKIRITDEKKLTDEERKLLKIKSESDRSKGISLAENICRRYRREGRFFDEILKEGGFP